MLARHAIKTTDKDKMLTFEMYRHRKILHLNWTMKVTSRVVRNRLNIKADLMQTVMKRKLGLFGYICRTEDSRKIKSVMSVSKKLGIMDGKGRRGGPN